MSFSHLATLGTCSYNGHTFDGASTINVHVDYVTDEAERTILYGRHTVTIHTYLNSSSGAGVESDILALRARLSHQGGQFILTGHGFGNDLRVNVSSGGLRDVKFGPKPEFLSWNPVGSNNTVEVEWQVVVCVPTCSTNGPSIRSTGIMAINYGVSIDINPHGLSTRTIAGYLEIAQTRLPNKAIPDSADRYRPFINPPQLSGFERTSSFAFSLDKSRVDFIYTDRQMASKNPYPIGVIRMDASHEVRQRQRDARSYHNLSFDIDMAPPAAPTLAWLIFGNLVRQRVQFLIGSRNNGGGFPWMLELSAREDIFGFTSSFSLSYRVLKTVETLINGRKVEVKDTDLTKQGLWQPITGTDWRFWKQSLLVTQGQYGLTGLTVQPTADAIVDLCGSNTTIPWASPQAVPITIPRITAPVLRNEIPPANQSFLDYKTSLVVSRNTAVTRQSTMQAPVSDNSPADQQRPQGMTFPPPAAQSSGSSPVQDTIQRSGLPRYSVTVVGHATRAGYEIPQPRLVQVGSQTPIEVAATFMCEQVGNYFGVPVFRAMWNILYELASPPGNVSPPQNLKN